MVPAWVVMTYISVLTEAHAVSSELFIFSASFPLIEAGVLLGGEHLVGRSRLLSKRICCPAIIAQLLSNH